MTKKNNLFKNDILVREEFAPHGKNLTTKINNKNPKSTLVAKFKKEKYEVFSTNMKQLDFSPYSIHPFEQACQLIDTYYSDLSDFVEKNKIDTRSGIKSSLIEEISKYLFINHPLVTKYNLLFHNKDIRTGVFFSKDHLAYTKKDVDFCICQINELAMNNHIDKDVFTPIISVECKTYLDGTMFSEVVDTATRIKSSSPDAHCFVLMLYNSVGKDTFEVRRKATNVTEFYALTTPPPKKNAPLEKLHPDVLYAYYKGVSTALEEYFKEYTLPSFGSLINI